jgi:membrane protein implicated in regulation of membrane protease activity
MTWWLWLVLGLVLLASEIFTPGAFFVFFFGLAAIVVGLVVVGGGAPDWLQWGLFSLLSILSVVFLRRPLLARIMPVGREDLAVDSLVGEVATLLQDLPPGAIGKAELRGSSWTAKNVDARPLARGERSVVAQVDGLVLSLRAQ